MMVPVFALRCFSRDVICDASGVTTPSHKQRNNSLCSIRTSAWVAELVHNYAGTPIPRTVLPVADVWTYALPIVGKSADMIWLLKRYMSKSSRI